MKTSNLFSSVFVSVFALGVLAGCGSAKEKTHFGTPTPDAGDSPSEPSTPRTGGHTGSGSGSGSHPPTGSPSGGHTGSDKTGGGTGSTDDAGSGITPDGGNVSPGPGGTGTDPGKKGGSTPPPASVDDDPAGIDTEFLDDRGAG